MKRKIGIMLSGLILAAPAPAEGVRWEWKDVTHTLSARAGDSCFRLDGKEVALPPGVRVYEKDGRTMLPAEPLAQALGTDGSEKWSADEEGVLYMAFGEHTLCFHTAKDSVLCDGRTVEEAGVLEAQGSQLFASLRGWKAILARCGYTLEENAVAWDGGTRTATLRFTGTELEMEKEPVPAGTGAAPAYTLPPTREYDAIHNLGDGYFQAREAETEEDGRNILIDSRGNILMRQEFAAYLGESRFLTQDFANGGEREVRIADETGKIVFSRSGRSRPVIGNFSEGLTSIEMRGEDGWTRGYLDTNGNLAISADFEEIRDFSEGMAAVMREGRDKERTEKWGYIDRTGRLAVDTKYKACGAFHEGLAAVRTADGKWGYIDKSGKEVIPPQYDGASAFYNGTAFVTERGNTRQTALWLIDQAGRKRKLLADDIPAGTTMKGGACMFRRRS